MLRFGHLETSSSEACEQHVEESPKRASGVVPPLSVHPPEGTKRATSINVQLLRLQKDLRTVSILRDIVLTGAHEHLISNCRVSPRGPHRDTLRALLLRGTSVLHWTYAPGAWWETIRAVDVGFARTMFSRSSRVFTGPSRSSRTGSKASGQLSHPNKLMISISISIITIIMFIITIIAIAVTHC